MEKILEKINKILGLMGFCEVRVQTDDAHRRISIFIDEDLSQDQIPTILRALDTFVNLMLKRENLPSHIVDLNLYRKERERIILELAKAAAHKAMMSKLEVELPPMNAYERRLIHVEITTHPELKTESIGLGKERRVVIKLLTT
ncbi:MAG: R3H domain-containing nucleic acid-binding protein [Patescibacteria group bacterium]